MGSLNSYRFIGTSDDLWRAGINTTDVRALASRREETGIRGLGMHRIKKKARLVTIMLKQEGSGCPDGVKKLYRRECWNCL